MNEAEDLKTVQSIYIIDLVCGCVHSPLSFSSTRPSLRNRTKLKSDFNPSTAPAYKISGLKDARTRLQIVYFPVL